MRRQRGGSVRSENPELRYAVGTTIIQARMNMPDR